MTSHGNVRVAVALLSSALLSSGGERVSLPPPSPPGWRLVWRDEFDGPGLDTTDREPRTVHGTVHGPGYSGAHGVSSAHMLADRAFADDWHVFAVEWEPDAIRWYVDDSLYKTVTPRDLPGQWVFDHPFFIILNVAVGGNWPGDPDSSTVFPQAMRGDYVRVYEKARGPAESGGG